MEDAAAPDEASDEFVAVLTEHQSAMLACIRTLTSGNPGAGDLLQEVNGMLWEVRDSYLPGVDFKAWAFETIRGYLAANRPRLKSEGWLVFESDLLERMTPDLGEAVDEMQRRQTALHQCLAKLRPKERDLLHHRYAPGASIERYAAATRRDTGTVKNLLGNLRASLQRCVEKQLRLNPPHTPQS